MLNLEANIQVRCPKENFAVWNESRIFQLENATAELYWPSKPRLIHAGEVLIGADELNLFGCYIPPDDRISIKFAAGHENSAQLFRAFVICNVCLRFDS